MAGVIAREVPVPAGSGLHRASRTADFCDCFEVPLSRLDLDAEALYRGILIHAMPRWVDGLMRVRNRIAPLFGARPVKPFDLEAEAPGSTGPFSFHARGPSEVIVGDDDAHLDFRLGLLKEVEGGRGRVTLTTVVTFKGLSGRLYLWMVLPFHKLILRTTLRNAARDGLV